MKTNTTFMQNSFRKTVLVTAILAITSYANADTELESSMAGSASSETHSMVSNGTSAAEFNSAAQAHAAGEANVRTYESNAIEQTQTGVNNVGDASQGAAQDSRTSASNDVRSFLSSSQVSHESNVQNQSNATFENGGENSASRVQVNSLSEAVSRTEVSSENTSAPNEFTTDDAIKASLTSVSEAGIESAVNLKEALTGLVDIDASAQASMEAQQSVQESITTAINESIQETQAEVQASVDAAVNLAEEVSVELESEVSSSIESASELNEEIDLDVVTTSEIEGAAGLNL